MGNYCDNCCRQTALHWHCQECLLFNKSVRSCTNSTSPIFLQRCHHCYFDIPNNATVITPTLHMSLHDCEDSVHCHGIWMGCFASVSMFTVSDCYGGSEVAASLPCRIALHLPELRPSLPRFEGRCPTVVQLPAGLLQLQLVTTGNKAIAALFWTIHKAPRFLQSWSI